MYETGASIVSGVISNALRPVTGQRHSARCSVQVVPSGRNAGSSEGAGSCRTGGPDSAASPAVVPVPLLSPVGSCRLSRDHLTEREKHQVQSQTSWLNLVVVVACGHHH